MRALLAVLVLVGCGADGQAAALRTAGDAGEQLPEAGSGAGEDAASVLPDASTEDAGAEDSGESVAPDAAVQMEDASVAPDAGVDSGVIVVGPGEDDAGEPLPYFELACPDDPCPAQPNPERERFVETNLCYSGAEAVTCTFFCAEHVASEGATHIYPGRTALCESLGGHCKYLDASGDPVPDDQELTTESSYCLPSWAP